MDRVVRVRSPTSYLIFWWGPSFRGNGCGGLSVVYRNNSGCLHTTFEVCGVVLGLIVQLSSKKRKASLVENNSFYVFGTSTMDYGYDPVDMGECWLLIPSVCFAVRITLLRHALKPRPHRVFAGGRMSIMFCYQACTPQDCSMSNCIIDDMWSAWIIIALLEVSLCPEN